MKILWPALGMALSLLLTGCGYHYRLPGHGPGQVATVTLREGEKTPALREGFIPVRTGYRLSMSSEDPSIADVAFHGDPRRAVNIWLVAHKPGSTVVHYGNLYNQTAPFAISESARLGVSLPGLPTEMRGAGKGPPRRFWLRQTSDAAFRVNVLPAPPRPPPPSQG